MAPRNAVRPRRASTPVGESDSTRPASADASDRPTLVAPTRPRIFTARWCSLGGLGTLVGVPVRSSNRVGRRGSRAWGWSGAAFVAALVFALGTAHAAPPPPPPAPAKAAPAKPTPAPAKPPATTPAKPAATTPAKPAATTPAKPAPTAPATAPAGTKPAATTTTPPAAGKKSADPLAGPADSSRQSEIYGDRIDGLSVEVDALKDKIFRSRARLSLLRETVLKGVLAGSRVVLAHRNLMGSGFRLTRIVIIMDGAQIYAKTDESGGLDSEDELVIYDGNLPPGPHNVTIEMTYKGHGYGVFAYLSGYTFDSRSSHSFTAPENGALKLTSVGFERGNMTTEMRDRPSVSWQELPLDAAGRPLPSARGRAKAKEPTE